MLTLFIHMFSLHSSHVALQLPGASSSEDSKCRLPVRAWVQQRKTSPSAAGTDLLAGQEQTWAEPTECLNFHNKSYRYTFPPIRGSPERFPCYFLRGPHFHHQQQNLIRLEESKTNLNKLFIECLGIKR